MFTTTQPKARWTLVAALILGLAGGAVAPRAAHADQVVRTNTEANLRARPGERAPTLAHLDEGQTVRVLGRQGRWLKVSVKGKVGWITRTQVADDGEPMSARASSEKKRTAAAKARSKKGWSSMDDEAVGADAVESDDEEASADDESATASDEGDDSADEGAPAKMKKKNAKAEREEKAERERQERAEAEQAEKDEKAAEMKAKKAKKQASAKIAKGGEVVAVRRIVGHAKPSKKSDERFDAKKGAQLTVVAINEEGDWIKVEDAEGDKGWVAKKDLRASGDESMDSDEGDAVAESDSGSDVGSSDDSDGESRGVRKMAEKQGPMMMWVSASGGVLNRTQTYVSGGTGLKANYGLANTAPAVIGGLGFVRRAGSFNLGADAGIIATMGGSGIAIAGSNGGMAETLAWSALEIDVHGNLQYVLSPRGYAIGARAGYHVSSVTVDVSTQAKLPSEKLAGFTVGGVFEAPRLTDKIGMRVGADLLMGGTLLQTQGLQDGESSAASVMFLNAGATYSFTPRLGANASYQLAYETFAFAGANQREPSATKAKREDLQHVFGLGLAYVF